MHWFILQTVSCGHAHILKRAHGLFHLNYHFISYGIGYNTNYCEGIPVW